MSFTEDKLEQAVIDLFKAEGYKSPIFGAGYWRKGKRHYEEEN
jgi:hypothetical protein